MFAPSPPSAPTSSHCQHCCCHCGHPPPPSSHQTTVTFARSPASPTSATTALKPVLKQSPDSSGQQVQAKVQEHEEKQQPKKIELRPNKNPLRPRPRSVAVPNPASSPSSHLLEEVRLVSMPGRQTAELVEVKEKGVTFHTVLERPQERGRSGEAKGKHWKNLFQGGRSRSGGHREVNIDEAMLPENRPLGHRPRPRSEINLSYNIQDSTLMLTPLKNNEFQVMICTWLLLNDLFMFLLVIYIFVDACFTLFSSYA